MRPSVQRASKELQPQASNRQIAKTLGVNRPTIDRDIGADAPPEPEKHEKSNEPDNAVGANAPPSLSGAEAAALAKRIGENVANATYDEAAN
jgi:hypothetical protein